MSSPGGSAIATLALFVASIFFVIHPVSIPTPRRIPAIPLNLTTVPVLAVAILWAAQCLNSTVIRNAIIGTEGIKPYNIIILIFSLAYMASTLDITGILQAAAFWVSNKGVYNGWKLYLYFYVMFTLVSILLGNDPIIHSGTAFLVYYTRVAKLDGIAWTMAQFAATNMAGMVLFVGNPTNVVICEAFGVNNITFTAYTIFPFIACNVFCFVALAFQYRKQVPCKSTRVPYRDPRSALRDPIGALMGSFMLGATLIMCPVVGYFGIDAWMISLPFAFVKLLFDLGWDWYRVTRNIPIGLPEVEESEESSVDPGQEYPDDDTDVEKLHSPTSETETEPAEDISLHRSSLTDMERSGSVPPQVGGSMLGATLTLCLVVSFFAISVWVADLPFAFFQILVADLGWDWYRLSHSVPIGPLEAAEDGVTDESLEDVEDGSSSITNVGEPQSDPSESDSHEMDAQPSPAQAETRPMEDVPPTDMEQSGSVPSRDTATDRSYHGTLAETNMLNGLCALLHRRFPTVMTALPRLPFALVPFAFSQVILIEALNHQGWVTIFANWLVLLTHNQVYPTIWLIGVLGVVLCNVSGTNIGATILLTQVVRAAHPPYDAHRAAAISLAIACNIGAVGFVFSASLGGLLWRSILEKGKIHMRQMDFALWNLLPLVVMTIVGLAVVSAEVAILFPQSS